MSDFGRGLIETIFSIAVIFIFFGVFTVVWALHLEEARKVAIQNQLTNLKYSLELYIMLEGSYPIDLRELERKTITLKEDSLYGKRYLEFYAKDKQGYPVDVYGRRFIYDNKTGKVQRGKE